MDLYDVVTTQDMEAYLQGMTDAQFVRHLIMNPIINVLSEMPRNEAAPLWPVASRLALIISEFPEETHAVVSTARDEARGEEAGAEEGAADRASSIQEAAPVREPEVPGIDR